MSGKEPDVEWARAHRARFEVDKLKENVGGRQTPVGFTISLYARMPLEGKSREERVAAAAEIRARLCEILQSLAPAEDADARLEIEPPRPALFFQAKGEMEPEIAVNARVFHRSDYYGDVTKAEEDKFQGVLRRLAAAGLK